MTRAQKIAYLKSRCLSGHVPTGRQLADRALVLHASRYRIARLRARILAEDHANLLRLDRKG